MRPFLEKRHEHSELGSLHVQTSHPPPLFKKYTLSCPSVARPDVRNGARVAAPLISQEVNAVLSDRSSLHLPHPVARGNARRLVFISPHFTAFHRCSSI